MSVNESILEPFVPVTTAEASSDDVGGGLVDRIQALEAAASSLDPGAEERGRLHDAVRAVVERFLSGLETLPGALEDAAARYGRFLDMPITVDVMGIESS